MLLLKFSLIGGLAMATGVTAGGWISRGMLQELAQQLLALQLGPIARVVVKRAAERTRQRDALFSLLAEAVPATARARLLADLARL